MTLEEAIKNMETIAEENQRVVDTGIVFNDVTIDMLYCDDTEVIEEHLANYQRRAEEHRQLAEWLKELKQLKEQTRWIPRSERLPETGTYIFVSDGGEVAIAYFGKDNRFRDHWGDKMKDISAWMPLPKPYESEEENAINN